MTWHLAETSPGMRWLVQVLNQVDGRWPLPSAGPQL